MSPDMYSPYIWHGDVERISVGRPSSLMMSLSAHSAEKKIVFLEPEGREE